MKTILFSTLLACGFSATMAQNIDTPVYRTASGKSTFAYGRILHGVQLVTSSGNVLSISDIQKSGNDSIYFDRTSRILEVKAGELITPMLNFEGSSMYAYIYIDGNKNGTFDTSLGANGLPTPNGELRSFSSYKSINSVGRPVGDEDANITRSNVPAFTVPYDLPAGDYRMRIKVDFNSLDPCGGPNINALGGCMVDMTLRVNGEKCAQDKGKFSVRILEQPTDGKFKLDWSDEFNGDEIDWTRWGKIPKVESGKSPDWRNYMSECDTLYAVEYGALVLRGIKNANVDMNDSREYLTGGIYSCAKQVFTRGRMEIRAKLTSAQGGWPAIWMKPDVAKNWPVNGEIDIMEHLNYDTIAYQTVHNSYTLSGGSYPQKGSVGVIDKDGWNVYTVDMKADTVTFYINGKKTLDYPRRPELAARNQFPYDQAFYLLLDMQLGGSWVGNVTGADLPCVMYIDYCRFYRREGEGGRIVVNNNDSRVYNNTKIEENSLLKVTVEAFRGYELRKLFKNGVDVTEAYRKGGDVYTCLATEDFEFSADFAEVSYPVACSSMGKGVLKLTNQVEAVVTNGSMQLSGASVRVYVSPSKGYYLSEYKINGVDAMPRLQNMTDEVIVRKPTNISVRFEKIKVSSNKKKKR